MNTINIRNNFPEVAARLNSLPEQIGNRAMVRALNQTMTQGKTEMARRISSEYRITVGKAKERLAVDRAVARGSSLRFRAVLSATKRGKGRSMNLIAFLNKARLGKAAARRAGTAGLAGQLQFQIKRAGGKKVIKGAFVANAGRTVFIRTGKERLPIKALSTIDVPQMFNSKRIHGAVRQVILDKFPANFQRELRAVLQGYAR